MEKLRSLYRWVTGNRTFECPNCGEEVDPRFEECENCGRHVLFEGALETEGGEIVTNPEIKFPMTVGSC